MKKNIRCFRCGRSELALCRNKSVNMIYGQLQSSLRDAHPRMRPRVLQICVFMSSVFTKGCALTFSQGVFVHKNAKVTFAVTTATKFLCLSSSCASCHVTSVGYTTLLSNFYTTVQVKGSYFTEHQIGFLFERRIFHDSSTLFLWIWKAGVTHFPQLHCIPAPWHNMIQ